VASKGPIPNEVCEVQQETYQTEYQFDDLASAHVRLLGLSRKAYGRARERDVSR